MSEGVMNQVMGAVGSGVQPRNSAMPTGPAEATGAPTLGSVLGQQMPRQLASGPAQSFGSVMGVQQAPPQPSPDVPKPQVKSYADQQADDSTAADEVLQSLRAQKNETTPEEEDPVLKALKEHNEEPKFDENNPAIDPRKPNENPFDYVKRLGKEELQFLGAHNRGNLGNEVQKKTAFESMYGKDNVQMRGDKLYFKPDGAKTFRPVDQVQMGLVADFFARHAAQAPGLAAGGVGEVAALWSGVGAAAAPAAGGFAMGATNYALQKAIDGVSDQPQIAPGQDASALGHQVLEGTTAMYGGRLLNFAAGKGAQVIGAGGRWGVDKLENLLYDKEIPTIIDGVAKKASAEQKTGAILQAWDNVTAAIKGSTSTGVARSEEAKVGRDVGNAVDSLRSTLGARIGLIKDRALDLAEQTGTKVDPASLLQVTKQNLIDYGVKFDEYGFVKPETLDAAKNPALVNAFGDSRGHSEVKNIATLYDSVLSANLQNGKQGVELQAMFNHMNGIGESADYDTVGAGGKMIRKVPDQISRVYKDIRAAAADDTYGTMDKLFVNTGSPEETTWRSSYKNYSDKIDQINKVNSFMKDDAQRATFVERISNAAPERKLRLLTDLKNTVLKPEVWNSLRGEMLNNQVTKFIDPGTGVFNSRGFMQAFGSMAPEVRNTLFSSGEYRTVMQVGAEAYKISMADKELSSAQKEIIEKGIGMAADVIPGGKAAGFFFKIFNGNKQAIDYALDHGFLYAARTAENAGQKKAILQAMRITEDAVNKMAIANQAANSTPVKASSPGFMKQVARYVPAAGIQQGIDASPLNAGSPVPEQPMPTQQVSNIGP